MPYYEEDDSVEYYIKNNEGAQGGIYFGFCPLRFYIGRGNEYDIYKTIISKILNEKMEWEIYFNRDLYITDKNIRIKNNELSVGMHLWIETEKL
jgi:hypothetical protein